jgi:ADP-ribose pyrophosphatase
MLFIEESEFGNKVDGVQYKEREGVYGIILNSDKEIALVKTNKGYFLPGGGIENIETHEECLQRECSEEIGYNIAIGEYLGKLANYIVSFKNKEYLKVVGYIYIAQLLDANLLKIEKDHELIWLPIEQAIDKMYPEFQSYAIKKYIEHQES